MNRIFSKKQKQKQRKSQKSWGIFMLVYHLWPYLRRHPVFLTCSIFCMLLYTLVSRVLPILIGYIIDNGIELKQLSNVLFGVTIYAVCMLIHTFCSFGQYYLFQRYGNRIVFYIRQQLMEHIQNLPLSFFDKNPKGKIATQIINDSTKLGQLFNAHIFSTFSHIISCFSILFVMFYISPKLSFIALSLSPFFLWRAWRVNLRLNQFLHAGKRILSKLNSTTVENLKGMEVLQVHNKKQEKAKAFNASCMEYRSKRFDIGLQSAHLRVAMNLFQASILMLSLTVGVQMKWTGALSIGALTAFLINIQHLAPFLRMILENYQALQDGITSAERIFSLLKHPQESSITPSSSNPSPSISASPIFPSMAS